MSALARRLGKLEAAAPGHLPKSIARWLGQVPHPDAPEHSPPSDTPLSREAIEWLNLPGRGAV